MTIKRKNSKESTSNLFNRYVWLVDLIYRKKNITFEEINEQWLRSSLNYEYDDLPLRTFHNHRKAIEQMFDINIECDKRNGYSYYIENSEDMERGGVRSWLLNTFAVNNLINESHKLKHRILFEKIPGGQEHLTTVIEAMRDNFSLTIIYQAFWQDNPATFEIHPYFIRVFKQRWYLIAFNPKREKIQTYALDRIRDMSITDNRFALPADVDFESYYDDCFGIITDDDIPAEKVLIKVRSYQAAYIKALPLHGSQKVVKSDADYTLFEYSLKPTYDFRQEILSHGADVEVLQPEWFREEIAAIVREQVEIYKNG
ncbi:MAG: WYL domain-containing protein [Porphyromonadaceae bacterium]|nr:WYL domain-containing protein [Porphyromonadaceae bacterium]